MSTHNIPFLMPPKNTLNYPKSAAVYFSQGTQERLQNSRWRRSISVRATAVLPYGGIKDPVILIPDNCLPFYLTYHMLK